MKISPLLPAILLISIFLFAFILLGCDSKATKETIDIGTQIKQQDTNLDLAEKLVEEASIGGACSLDIAEELVTGVLNAPATITHTQRATVLLGRIKKSSAQTEPDREKKKKLSQEAMDILTKFVNDSENSNYAGYYDAGFELAELLLELGMVSSRYAGLENNSQLKQELKSEAEKYFRLTAKYLSDAILYFRPLADNLETPTEEAEDNYVRAFNLQGINYYYWGLLYDKTEKERAKYLKEAIRTFKNLILRFSERFQAFDAADYVGLCYFELDDYANAKSYFRLAISLYDSIKNDPDRTGKEKEEILFEARDIIQKGYKHLAGAYDATKEHDKAKQVIDELSKRFPENQENE